MFEQAKVFSSFSVDNIEKAKDFYGKTLGIKFSDLMGGINLHFFGGNDIFVYPKDNHVPATFTILNILVKNVEKAVEDLTKLGIRFEIYNQGELKTNEKGITEGNEYGPKMAWFKDPAGNYLSLIEEKK
jgi:catechol 2,3-dioxygenase-like lactoylglutathione lyase family enzyme